MDDKITVLMSTYNGERYLREQIDSILNQINVKVKLVVRDDGSTDSTRQILEEYENQNKIDFIKDESNLGFSKSFWSLVLNAGDSQYFAFSDQDDVWLPNKLERAIKYIKKISPDNRIPVLYASNFFVTDDKLIKSQKQEFVNNIGLKPENYIVFQTRALGNSMVWNKTLQNIIIGNKTCDLITEHDSTMQFLAGILGKVIIDKKRTYLYRQHGNNISGGSGNSAISNYLKKRVGMIKKRLWGSEIQKHSFELRAKNFYRQYSNYLNSELASKIYDVATYRERKFGAIKLLLSSTYKGVPTKVKIRTLLHRL